MSACLYVCTCACVLVQTFMLVMNHSTGSKCIDVRDVTVPGPPGEDGLPVGEVVKVVLTVKDASLLQGLSELMTFALGGCTCAFRVL